MGNHKSKDRRHHSSNNPQNNHAAPQNNSGENQRARRVSIEAPPKFSVIRDKYETYEQLQDALRASGLESSNLIIGIYFLTSHSISL